MIAVSPALPGLMSAAAAVALVTRGLRRAAARRRDRRALGETVLQAVQMPKEPAAAPRSPSRASPATPRRPAPRPCPECGNPMDPQEISCPVCRMNHAQASGATQNKLQTLILHWLIFLAGFGLLVGLGYVLT